MNPTETIPLSVVVVDKNRFSRNSMVSFLEKAQGFRCAGAYGSAEEFLSQVEFLLPKLVLMEVDLPGISGPQCLHRLADIRPDIKVVMHSRREDAEAVLSSLTAGAGGYLTKQVHPAELVRALREASIGATPLCSRVSTLVASTFSLHRLDDRKLHQLTNREHRILTALPEGEPYKVIAAQTETSYETIHSHVKNIFKKLRIHSRSEAVAFYYRTHRSSLSKRCGGP